MNRVVIDASAIIEYLLRTERGMSVGGVLEATETDLHVPALCDVEVTSGIRRCFMAGLMAEGRMHAAIQDYLDLPLTRHGHEALLERMLELRDNFSAYDAAYVVLAEQLGAELLTADKALAKAVGTHTAIVLSAASSAG